MFIYIVTNTINGKRYVGQTLYTAASRWTAHCGLARRGSETQKPFHRAIRKYGKAAFEIASIPISAESLATLDDIERRLIADLHTLVPNGYNLREGGGSSRSHALTREKLRIANTGKHPSLETRARMSAAHKGIKKSPEHVAKVAAANRGKLVSDETRAKISAAGKGRKQPPFSAEHRARIGAAHKGNTYVRGRTLSLEHRAKIGASQKGKSKNLGIKRSVETKARMSAATKRVWAEGRKVTPPRVNGKFVKLEHSFT